MSHPQGAAHDDDHGIHLPPPSFSPALIGLGVTLIAFGLLFGMALVAVGGLLLLVGVATWLIDDARAYVQAGDPVDDAHGHGGR